MDFAPLIAETPRFLAGLGLTVQLTVLSVAIGSVTALGLALTYDSNLFAVRAPTRAFVYVFRGTPLLIQLYLIYYGLGQFALITDTFLWAFFKEAYACALLALTLNTMAYTTMIVRGAIRNTNAGEREAALAYGMSARKTFWRIVLPAALRRAIPAYGNEVIFLLHATSLVSTITLLDITGVARMVMSRYYNPFETFIFAALFYMALTFLLVLMFQRLERRYHRHIKR